MKRVGILTFHYADSYGAVLQSYALKKRIDSIHGCEAEVINYVPEGYQYHAYVHTMEGLEQFKEKISKLNSFVRSYCNVTGPLLREVSGNEYDCYCVGSDQVWNDDLRENITLEYFLPNISGDVYCFTYAASIGKRVDELKKDIFEKYLPKFKKISLRETKDYSDYFAKRFQRDCERVLDPTLLLERDDYETIIINQKLVEGPFIFFYWLALDDQLMKYIDYVNEIAHLYKLKIVHNIIETEAYGFVNDNICMLYAGVEEYLWYIKNADYVVTNSYHATIFSILFERKFYIHISELRRSRLDTLCEILHIQDRIIDEYIEKRRWNVMPDYECIKNKIQTEKGKSVSFLQQVLEEVEEHDYKHMRENVVCKSFPDIRCVLVEKSDALQKEMNRLHYQVARAYLRKKMQGWSIGEFFDKFSDKNIVIYAVTDFTEVICDDLLRQETKNLPRYICDLNVKKYGGTYKGFAVKGFDELVRDYKAGNIQIIINSNILRQKEIRSNLMNAGVAYEDIVPIATVVWS